MLISSGPCTPAEARAQGRRAAQQAGGALCAQLHRLRSLLHGSAGGLRGWPAQAKQAKRFGLALTERKEMEHSVATALASSVLPVPALVCWRGKVALVNPPAATFARKATGWAGQTQPALLGKIIGLQPTHEHVTNPACCWPPPAVEATAPAAAPAPREHNACASKRAHHPLTGRAVQQHAAAAPQAAGKELGVLQGQLHCTGAEPKGRLDDATCYARVTRAWPPGSNSWLAWRKASSCCFSLVGNACLQGPRHHSRQLCLRKP